LRVWLNHGSTEAMCDVLTKCERPSDSAARRDFYTLANPDRTD
jgi:hypothetical protein